MYITIYMYIYIYIYRFVHFISFVVPRGLGTHVTSLKRKEKQKKRKKSGNSSSLAARTYPIIVAFYVLRYIYVYVCTREHARVSVVEATYNLQALGTALSPSRTRTRTRTRFALKGLLSNRFALGVRPEVSRFTRYGCLSKLPREV